MGGVFACKQLLLAFNAPAIASELTIVAYHAMARDEHERQCKDEEKIQHFLFLSVPNMIKSSLLGRRPDTLGAFLSR